jgi:branched-chain amino acid transport system ATP-binding protein
MADPAARLNVSGLSAWYGPAQILSDVALEVGPGEALALLGRNGAGKSTTLKAIAGLVQRRGHVLFAGTEISHAPTHRIAQAGIGYVPEERRIFAELTVTENLEVGRRAPREGAPSWTLDRLFSLFPALAVMRGRPGGRMSGGEQQMLAIARTLMGNPSLVLLDEPFEGLAPKIVDELADAILLMKAEGLGLILSEQNLRVARRICNRAVILEKGRLRFAGSITELDADPAARDAYLAL